MWLSGVQAINAVTPIDQAGADQQHIRGGIKSKRPQEARNHG
jgi:hypothetical protein